MINSPLRCVDVFDHIPLIAVGERRIGGVPEPLPSLFRQPHLLGLLNTQEFREELDRVVNDLRKGVLKDLPSMRRYCYGSEGVTLTGWNMSRSFGTYP